MQLKHIICATAAGIIFLAGGVTVVTAADYSGYSTEDLAAMRGTLSNASDEERAAFRDEWRSRMQSLPVDQRQQYTGTGAGGGNRSGPRDGSGNQFKRGSGAGMGSGSGMQRGRNR
jgi:hypothetical protein